MEAIHSSLTDENNYRGFTSSLKGALVLVDECQARQVAMQLFTAQDWNDCVKKARSGLVMPCFRHLADHDSVVVPGPTGPHLPATDRFL